jgi:hypothetical protein
MTPLIAASAAEVIRKAGLNPSDFCIIRNKCFAEEGGFDALSIPKPNSLTLLSKFPLSSATTSIGTSIYMFLYSLKIFF